MIAFVKGTVVSFGTDHVILDHNGMGFKIQFSHPDLLKLNEEITVYTHMHVTENDIGLYGFRNPQEKELFLSLIVVKGVGPRTAMNMLACTDYRTIVSSIQSGDAAALLSLPGIGKKTASQIILDLKGKLVETEPDNKKTYSPEIEEACSALKNLGYRQADVNVAAKVMNEQKDLKTGEYLKIGLQYLLKTKTGG